LLGSGSVHASLIRGGRELSSYPDHCALQVERRTVPPESEQTVANELGALLEALARDDATFQATSRVTLVRSPWEADVRSDIARLTAQSVAEVSGRPAQTTTQTGWLDVALLGDAGIPCIVFGPSGAGAHAAEEWVDLESVETCARVYADVIQSFCA
jgi:acetylornithine deacetylase